TSAASAGARARPAARDRAARASGAARRPARARCAPSVRVPCPLPLVEEVVGGRAAARHEAVRVLGGGVERRRVRPDARAGVEGGLEATLRRPGQVLVLEAEAGRVGPQVLGAHRGTAGPLAGL